MDPHYFTKILYPEQLEAEFVAMLSTSTKEEQNLCAKALAFAKEKHANQRRDEGTPYYSHCIFAALLSLQFKGEIADAVTLLLHDTLEDTDTSFEELAEKFDLEIAENVRALSHKEKNISLTPEEYLQRLQARPHCFFHKACDRLANLYSTYVQPKRSKKVRMIESTYSFYIPQLGKYPHIVQEIEEVIKYIRAHAIIPKHLKLRIKELQAH